MPRHPLTTDNDKLFVARGGVALGGVAVYPALPTEKQTMEMTQYGRIENH
jgi:hypothetical protein